MNIKKFLKPDWRKIVITIILLIFSFLILIRPIFGQGRLMPAIGKAASDWEICCDPAFGVIHSRADIGNDSYCIERNISTLEVCEAYEKQVQFEETINNVIDTSTFVLLFPFCYIISCLIVWIYDKFKKKK